MKNLTTKQKQIIMFILAGLLVVATFFFVWKPNAEKVSTINGENSKLENQVHYLESLQTKVTELEQESQEKEKEMNEYLSCFAPKITLEKSIYYIYMMSIDSEISVTSIEPGNEEKFFENGQMVSDATSANGNGANKDASDKTMTKEQLKEKKPINQMAGKRAIYSVGVQGAYDNVMSALDWIRDHDENMSLGATTLAYDSGTGELSGKIEIVFYSMFGNGIEYEAPDLSGFKFGEDNIFGTFLADNSESGEDDGSEEDDSEEDTSEEE